MLAKVAGYGAYGLGLVVAFLGPLIFAIRTSFSTSTAVVGSLVSVACVIVAGALMTLGHMAMVYGRRHAREVGDLRGQLGLDFTPDTFDSQGTESMLAAFRALVPGVTRFTWVRNTSGDHWGTRVAGFSTSAGEERFVVRASASEERRNPAYLSLTQAVTFVRAESTAGTVTKGPSTAEPLPEVGHAAFNDEWVVRADAPESAQATMTDAVVDALNSYGQPGVTAVAGPDDVFVWSSPGAHADPGVAASLSSALYAAYALPLRHFSLEETEDATPAPSSGEDARLGRLRSDSAGRAQGLLRGYAGFISTGFLAAVAVVTRFSPPGGDPTNAWYLAAIQAGVLIVVGSVVMRLAPDHEKRQRAVATHALHLADSQGWRYQQEDVELERGWEKRPFGSVKRLTASPAASGPTTRGVLGGVAYLEGDLGVWPLFRVFSSRVVWAALPPGVPQMSIVRHNFRSRVAEMAGWGAVEVESDQFNRAWRVTASDPRAAHALLTPVVIDVLNNIAIEGITFLLDGERVVLWDDGRAKEVDLDARLELVDHLAAAVPHFWDRDGKM
jgi:hypothetical protein